MKTHKIIVVLLILLTVSAYATGNPVRGYETTDCTGEYLEVSNFEELWDVHKKADENGNIRWEFKSYNYVARLSSCYDFTKEAAVVETRPKNSGRTVVGSSTGGGAGGGSSGEPISLLAIKNALELANFDEDKNEELFECWHEKAADLDAVKEWVGKWTDTKWTTEYDADIHWKIASYPDPNNPERRGLTELTGDPESGEVGIKITLYKNKINQWATHFNIPFNHFVKHIQIEEYIHALQTLTEAKDRDLIYGPTKADKFAYELEAKLFRSKFWSAILGNAAPFHPPANETPKQYDKDRERYNELFLKNKKGTLVVDPDADPPIDEEAELLELDETFNQLNETTYPNQEKNDEYDAAALECD
ncbi:MAG: hypothetical protein OXG88_04705 [Gammaproteobacteria bacterium]|nr:hypothetical protein [Gammaproteobacteria bacterium]